MNESIISQVATAGYTDVFTVTERGRANEPLLGMVSVWDAMENLK